MNREEIKRRLKLCTFDEFYTERPAKMITITVDEEMPIFFVRNEEDMIEDLLDYVETLDNTSFMLKTKVNVIVWTQ